MLTMSYAAYILTPIFVGGVVLTANESVNEIMDDMGSQITFQSFIETADGATKKEKEGIGDDAKKEKEESAEMPVPGKINDAKTTETTRKESRVSSLQRALKQSKQQLEKKRDIASGCSKSTESIQKEKPVSSLQRALNQSKQQRGRRKTANKKSLRLVA